MTPREREFYAKLSELGYAATSQLASAMNADEGQTSRYLHRLKRKGMVDDEYKQDIEDIHTTWKMWRVIR